jgi:hypothetical protein
LLGAAKFYRRAGNIAKSMDMLRFVYFHRRSDPFTRGLARAELEALEPEHRIDDGLEHAGHKDPDDLWEIVDDFLEGKYDHELDVRGRRTSKGDQPVQEF